MAQDKPKAVSTEYNSKGQAIGVKAVERQEKVPVLQTDPELDKQEKNELEGAKDYERDSILRMQAKRRAARAAAKASPTPTETPKPVSEALAKTTPTPKK